MWLLLNKNKLTSLSVTDYNRYNGYNGLQNIAYQFTKSLEITEDFFVLGWNAKV